MRGCENVFWQAFIQYCKHLLNTNAYVFSNADSARLQNGEIDVYFLVVVLFRRMLQLLLRLGAIFV